MLLSACRFYGQKYPQAQVHEEYEMRLSFDKFNLSLEKSESLQDPGMTLLKIVSNVLDKRDGEKIGYPWEKGDLGLISDFFWGITRTDHLDRDSLRRLAKVYIDNWERPGVKGYYLKLAGEYYKRNRMTPEKKTEIEQPWIGILRGLLPDLEACLRPATGQI